MFKYDKYITNSFIITKYINKTYQHKNKCQLLTARFQKERQLKRKSNTPVYLFLIGNHRTKTFVHEV
jgi:hypothetical protein